MNPIPSDLPGKRVPIGYRLQRMQDGTLEVILESEVEPTGAELSPIHLKVINDYKVARRAVREYNRTLRARPAAPALDVAPLPPPDSSLDGAAQDGSC